MAKRLTDTEKWKDEWYLDLPNDWKVVWQYILDNCDHAGILKKNFNMLNFCCKTSIKEEQFLEIFTGRIVDCGSFFFIPKFLKFQYPNGLNSEKATIISVRNIVKEKNLSTIIRQSLGNHYLMIKDKDKDKDTEKDKEGGVGETKDKTLTVKQPLINGDKIPPSYIHVVQYCASRSKGVDPDKWFNYYQSNGWMIGKNKMKDWKASIRTWEKEDHNNGDELPSHYKKIE